MEYGVDPQNGLRVRQRLAELTGDNVDMIEGYLVVSVRIDGQLVVSHNSCCLEHILDGIREYMGDNPEINMLNPSLSKAHNQ